MTTKPKLAKQHVDRLVRMIVNRETCEAMHQVLYGDVSPGSTRAATNLDTASLRAVLAYLQEVQA